MIYLIGGPARCGKTVLAQHVRRKIDGEVISGDAYRDSLQRNLRPAWAPDIFSHVVAPLNKMSSMTRQVDRLRRRDEQLWQFYAGYIDSAVEAAPHEDILIEGNIWPDFISGLRHQYRAAFMVDTSPADEQFERMKLIRDNPETENNWMKTHGYGDRRLAKWAKFNLLRSQRYVQLCREYGHPYFDIARHGIQHAQDKAYDYLLKSSR